jgi:hypothetical protein
MENSFFPTSLTIPSPFYQVGFRLVLKGQSWRVVPYMRQQKQETRLGRHRKAHASCLELFCTQGLLYLTRNVYLNPASNPFLLLLDVQCGDQKKKKKNVEGTGEAYVAYPSAFWA